MATMKQLCRTDSTSTVFHNVWEIQQFNWEQGEHLESEAFHGYSSHGSDSEATWHYVLDVLESDQVLSNNRFVMRHSLMITVVIDSCNASLKATVELEPETYHDNSGLYKMSGVTSTGLKIGQIIVKRDNFLLFRSKMDSVTFCLKFSLVEEPMQQNSDLLENYSSLLSNEQLSDVTILVGQQKFYAQKAILSVRSPVFAAMFQSGMQESALNRLIVEDIEPEVFEQVLRYIYVGKVDRLEELSHDLLAAADKYALDRLRRMCEAHLSGHITKETVLKTLALADLHHAGELKDRAVRFIRGNIKTMQSTDWKAFAHSHPDLVADILSAMAIN